MSKVFFDKYVELGEIESEIKSLAVSEEEKFELWDLVDEIVHHRIMDCVFSNLPAKDHVDFLEKFQVAPYDDSLIDFLLDKVEDIEDKILKEVDDLKVELLELIRNKADE